MILPIVKYGDPVLKHKGERIDNITPDIKQLAMDMIETMRASDGIGLAAPQVGRSLQMFVVDIVKIEILRNELVTYDGERTRIFSLMPMVFINPEITIKGGRKDISMEGCLSFPGVMGFVERPFNIDVRFQDIDGKEHLMECSWLVAMCIQHEFDHCQGEVFIDKMERRDRDANQEIITALKKSTRENLQTIQTD